MLEASRRSPRYRSKGSSAWPALWIGDGDCSGSPTFLSSLWNRLMPFWSAASIFFFAQVAQTDEIRSWLVCAVAV